MKHHFTITLLYETDDDSLNASTLMEWVKHLIPSKLGFSAVGVSAGKPGYERFSNDRVSTSEDHSR